MSLSLHALSCVTPDGRRLFDDLNLAFEPGVTGLVGRNGAGKSTLLRLIAGESAPSSGAIAIEGEARLLRQRLSPAPDETIADAFGAGAMLARLDRLAAGEGDADDAAEADWTLEARIADALASFGLGALDPRRPRAALSGGEAMRADLAALAFDAPAVILLDEPTNNLDRAGREAVAALLKRWRGIAVVASHDRDLLAGADRIVELSELGAKTYGGGWDLYAARKAEERALAAQRLGAAERDLRDVERRIQGAAERKARADAAGKRNRASAGQPKILLDAAADRAGRSLGAASRLAERQRGEAAESLAAAQAEIERVREMRLALPGARLPAGKSVLRFTDVTGGPDPDAPVIRDLSFTISGPERIAVTGPNGAGKTTLLRLVTGELEPLSGDVSRGAPIAMLDQRVALLDPSGDVRTNFRRLNPKDDENACRAALARFLFRADAALKKVGDLSGGERLRAGLACVVGGSAPPGLLILDEPTNHLDLDAIAAVESGLVSWDGALLVVSHDDAFLRAIGIDRRIELGVSGPGA